MGTKSAPEHIDDWDKVRRVAVNFTARVFLVAQFRELRDGKAPVNAGAKHG
jgi:hypothetical protein